MKKLFLLMVMASLVAGVSACSSKRSDMKSLCVGTEDSPCGPKRHVNDWWLA